LLSLRTAFTLLWLLPALPAAASSCFGESPKFFPHSGGKLPINGRLVALPEKRGLEVPIFEKLPQLKLVLFSSATESEHEDEVPLRAERLQEGAQPSRDYWVLTPLRPLLAGRRYFLEPRTWLNQTERANWVKLGREIWWTAAPEDHTPPKWSSSPRVERMPADLKREPPEDPLNIVAPVTDDGPVLIQLTLRDDAGTEVTRLMPLSTRRDVNLGPDECSGYEEEPEIALGHPFRASLLALDSGGNAALAPGKPLRMVRRLPPPDPGAALP
jgi:hypothetical protein